MICSGDCDQGRNCDCGERYENAAMIIGAFLFFLVLIWLIF